MDILADFSLTRPKDVLTHDNDSSDLGLLPKKMDEFDHDLTSNSGIPE